jgi:hypothetical protein
MALDLLLAGDTNIGGGAKRLLLAHAHPRGSAEYPDSPRIEAISATIIS